MIDKEQKEIYEVDNQKYIVTTKVIEKAKSLDCLYKAFCGYALRKLNVKI